MVDLSHFYGVPVKHIVMHGDDEHEWAIEFEDGTQLRNYDGRRTTLPEIPENYSLLTVIMDKSGTTARFGVTGKEAEFPPVEITFTPSKYSLAQGRVPGEIWPQSIDIAEREALAQAFIARIPPHPDERVQEGPEDASEAEGGEDGAE